ncbi:MAG: gliding motility-associated C-terminal domain-containing protein [Bacteroidota bacterium]
MKKLCSSTLAIFVCLNIIAQDFDIADGNSVQLCGGTFYDAQGPNPYLPGNSNQIRIRASEIYFHVQMDFSQFDLGPIDEVIIYDGPDASSPQVPGSPFTLNNSPGTIVSTGDSFFVEFNNDLSSSGEGWEAEISCRSDESCFAHFSYELDQPWSQGSFCYSGQSFGYCYTLYEWNGGGSPNAFHGLNLEQLNPTFPMNISVVSLPNSCDGNGEWVFVNDDDVLSTGTGDFYGPGFFYEADLGTGLDMQTGNNQGDQCIPPEGLQFCWTASAGYCEILWDGPFQDIGLSILPLSDGISGAFNDETCLSAESISFYASLGCEPHDGCWDCPAEIIDWGGEIFCGEAGIPIIELAAVNVDGFGCNYSIYVDGVYETGGWDCFYWFEPVIDEINGTEVYVEIDNGQCFASATYFYQVILPPEVSISGGGTICGGNPASILFDLTTPNTIDVEYIVEYSIDGIASGSVVLSSSNPSTIIDVWTPGVYEIINVTSIVDGSTCNDYDASGVAVVDAGSGGSAELWGDTTICAGNTANIFIEFSGGSPPYTGDLYFNGNFLSSISENSGGIFVYPFQFFENGTVELYFFTSSGAGGCAGTVNGEVQIEVGNNLMFDLNGMTLELCPGEEAEMQLEIIGFDTDWTLDYSLNGVGQTPLSNNQENFLFTTDEEGIYSFEHLSDGSCTIELDNTIEVSYLDSVFITFQESITLCEGNSGQLQINFSEPGSNQFEYSIDGILQGQISTSDNPYNLNVFEEGEYVIESFLWNNQCPGFMQNVVSVDLVQAPDVMVNSAISICPYESQEVELELNGNGPWIISYELNSAPGILDTIFTLPGTFPVNEAGEYLITGVNNTVCSGSFSGQIDVNHYSLPDVFFDEDEVICSNALSELNMTFTGEAPFYFDLELDGMPFGSFSSADNSMSLPINLEGNYSIVSLVDAHCQSNPVDLFELSYFEAPSIDLMEDGDVCIHSYFETIGSATGGFGGPFQYWWVVGNDTLEGNQLTHQINEPQTFEFLVDDGCGILYGDSIVIGLHPYPSFEFMSLGDSLCGPQLFQLDSDIPLNTYGQNCTWNVNGTEYNVCDQLELNISEVGTAELILQVESIEGCTTIDTLDNAITILPVPEARFSFSPDPPTLVNNLVNFYSGNPNEWGHSWIIDESHQFSDEVNADLILEGEIGDTWMICHAIVNEFNCPDTTCELLRLGNELTIWIPNSFTPNADGINDVYRPQILGGDDNEYEFRIWNRWGELVFETEDVEEGWPGTGMENKEYYAENEVFVWQIITKPIDQPELEEFKGSVTLVR